MLIYLSVFESERDPINHIATSRAKSNRVGRCVGFISGHDCRHDRLHHHHHHGRNIVIFINSYEKLFVVTDASCT